MFPGMVDEITVNKHVHPLSQEMVDAFQKITTTTYDTHDNTTLSEPIPSSYYIQLIIAVVFVLIPEPISVWYDKSNLFNLLFECCAHFIRLMVMRMQSGSSTDVLKTNQYFALTQLYCRSPTDEMQNEINNAFGSQRQRVKEELIVDDIPMMWTNSDLLKTSFGQACPAIKTGPVILTVADYLTNAEKNTLVKIWKRHSYANDHSWKFLMTAMTTYNVYVHPREVASHLRIVVSNANLHLEKKRDKHNHFFNRMIGNTVTEHEVIWSDKAVARYVDAIATAFQATTVAPSAHLPPQQQHPHQLLQELPFAGDDIVIPSAVASVQPQHRGESVPRRMRRRPRQAPPPSRSRRALPSPSIPLDEQGDHAPATPTSVSSVDTVQLGGRRRRHCTATKTRRTRRRRCCRCRQ